MLTGKYICMYVYLFTCNEIQDAFIYARTYLWAKSSHESILPPWQGASSSCATLVLPFSWLHMCWGNPGHGISLWRCKTQPTEGWHWAVGCPRISRWAGGFLVVLSLKEFCCGRVFVVVFWLWCFCSSSFITSWTSCFHQYLSLLLSFLLIQTFDSLPSWTWLEDCNMLGFPVR